MVLEPAAIVMIKDAPTMTKRGRKNIAAWLRRQAYALEHHAEDLGRRYTARWLYEACGK